MTPTLFKKQHLLIFICLLLGQTIALAQTPNFARSTQNISSGIFLNSATYLKTQLLYEPTDLVGTTPISGGIITKIYFSSTTASQSGTYTEFYVRMGQTTNTTFTGTNNLTFYNTLDTVFYRSSVVLNGSSVANDWFEIPLDQEFVYDPAKTLIVEVQMASQSGGIATWSSGTGAGSPAAPNHKKMYSTAVTAATGTQHSGYWQDFGISLIPISYNNAAITQIDLPSVICSSSETLKVRLANRGNNVINNVDVQWTLDGVPQTTLSWSSPLDTANNPNSNPVDTLLTLGTISFSPMTARTIKVWSSMPNGVVDTSAYNDTMTVIVGGALSGTYTIGGTSPSFATIGAAVSALNQFGVCGPVTFNLDSASGPYNEQLTISQINGTLATNTVTFNGNGSIVQFAPTTANRHVIRLDGADYITLNDLRIVSTDATYGYGIHLINGADYNTIQNCVVDVSAVTSTTEANSAAITASASSTTTLTAGNNANYLTIINDTIIGGYSGIVLNGASATAPGLNCIISQNVIRDFYSTGVNILNMDTTIIAHNDIHRMNRTAVGTFSGVNLRAGNIRTNVTHNKIHGTHNSASTLTGTAYGFEIVSCDAPADSANVFSNNLIYDFNSASGTIYGIYNSGSNGTKFYHNTIVLDHAAATGGITRGVYQVTLATDIDIRNNIIHITRGGTGVKYCLYFGTTTSSIISDNNVLYMNAAAGTNGTGYYGAGFTLLPDWKAANSAAYDQNSKANNPSFVSMVAPLDYTPSEVNINNIGADVGVATDFTGALRGASPDPGAYEFTPSVTLDAGITWVSPVDLVTAGSHNITVEITNTLSTTITSLDLAYTDGTTPVTESFGSLSIAAGNSQQITFSTPYNFTVPVNMRAYITSVNGSADGSQNNDSTFVKSICIGMPGGTYTINSALPTGGGNFQSFTDAVNAISSCGIVGPVVFDVDPASGPYNEHIIIPSINGASEINTIIFNGNNRTIQDTSVSATRAIIRLDGADYVTIDSLNLISLSATYGWGIHLTNGADYNQITNCTIDMSMVTSTTESNSACIVASGSTTSVLTDGNANYNIIHHNTLIGGYKGITINGSTGSLLAVKNQITNNIIRDFYQNGMEFTENDSLLVEHNDISRANSVAVTTMAGIELGAGNQNCIINANRIHDTHNSATTQSGTAYGIYSTANDAPVGSHNTVSNNVIYNFNSLTGTQYGIYNSGSNGVHYYYNTVSLSNQTSTAGITRGFYQLTAATDIELKNNIFDISRTGTGAKNCVYFGTATSSIVSDNNLLNMASTTGTVGVGYHNATNYITLTDWKTANSNAYDQQSVSADPMFNSSTNFRLLNGSPALGIAAPLADVLTDYSGNIRSTITPTAGAHEIPGDFLGPQINIIPLSNSSSTTNRSTGFTVSITDVNDVDTSAHKPRIYYKKKSDNNAYVGNTNSDNGWKWTVATNTTSPFNFVIDYSIINGGSVSLGDTLQYFIAAQDLASSHNVGTGTVVLNTDADSIELTAAHFPVSGSINNYRIVAPISGTFFVGASSTPYHNLTDVANALRSTEVTGNVSFELMPDYDGTTETLPIVFNQISVASPALSIHIGPHSSVSLPLVTEGDPGSGNALITIDGGNQMVFDGRAGAAGDSTSIKWTIRNNRAAATYSPTILLTNGATYNKLTYLDIQSGNTLATSGTVMFDGTNFGTGNSYNTISNNYIRNRTDVTGVPANAIYSLGNGLAPNSNNNIDSNRISNFTTSAVSIALSNGDNWNIRNNHIYHDWTSAPTTAQSMINFAAASNNNTISENYIGGSTINADGTPWPHSGNTAIIGITAAFSNGTASVISHNTLKNLARTNTGAGAFSGIIVTSGNASVNHNIIGDSLVPNSISLTGTGAIVGISNTNSMDGTVVNIENNRISNITSTNASTATIMRGISYTSGAPYPPCNIRNNRISNLKTNSAQTGYAAGSIAAQGIYTFPSGYSYDSTSEISGNYIYDIEATNTTAATNVAGITLTNFWGSCHHNTIYGIRNYSQKGSPIPATANGMFVRFLQSNSYIHNNMISLTSTPSDSAQINGIMVAGGTAASYGGVQVYLYNTVKVSNAGGGSPVNTYAFHRGENDPTIQSYQPVAMKNNLFINSVTSLGNHYAVGDQGVAPGSNWIATETDYNDYYSNATNLALYGNIPVDLATWRTSTGGDANSITENVQFVDATVADLHLTGSSLGNLQLAGTPIAGYTIDFDGEVRHATKPYMGADENIMFPLPVKLLQFSATAFNDDVNLFWATASETNSNRFEIQRSVDGKTFKTVDHVKAAGKSSTVLNYKTIDVNAFDIANSNTLYYRLKIVDNDGSFEFSNTVIVKLKAVEQKHPLTVYPNPFRDGTYMELEAQQTSVATITVVDITGKTVINYTPTVMEGHSVLYLNDSESLKPGIYFVTIELNGTKHQAKLIKQ